MVGDTITEADVRLWVTLVRFDAVLSGTIRLLLGEHDIVLRPGEVSEFDTRTPHWIGNPGSEPAEVLSLFGPQGERLHVRAQPAAG